MSEMTDFEKQDNIRAALDRLHGGLTTTPRECLIAALAAVADEARALAVVDALDEYLQEGPDRVPLRADLRSSVRPIDEVRAERDAALLRAEKAEHELQQAKKLKKSKRRGLR